VLGFTPTLGQSGVATSDKQLDNISNGLNDDLDAYRLKEMDMVQGVCDTMEELSVIP
jgi:hypothetical protein